MPKIFLKIEDDIVRENFVSAFKEYGAEVIDEENKHQADYILDDSKKYIGLRLIQKDGATIDVFQPPVDISHVVRVMERLDEELPLWDGCPIIVNFSTGVATCTKGRHTGEHASLTPTQLKVLKAMMPVGRLGISHEDLCKKVFGKIDLWTKTNLETTIYNINKRLCDFLPKPKIIVKTLDNSGKIRFIY